jgi:threonine/homoserine/homoserine lactone efflux protein
MELGLFVSLLSFLFVAAITPGPNNMLLTTSGAIFGFFRSTTLLLGIMLGMQCILTMPAFGIGSILLYYPPIHVALKIVGSLYLCWLAWKISSSPYENSSMSSDAAKPIGFWQGATLQLVNPKAWLMSLGAVASFSLDGPRFLLSITSISFAMLIVNCIAGFIWLAFGRAIGQWLTSPVAWRRFNRLMGLLTALSIIFVWL